MPMIFQSDYILDFYCIHTGDISIARVDMILGYKYMKGYHVDEERACKLGEVEFNPVERLKSVMDASRMIDRDEYMVTAVGYQVDDLKRRTNLSSYWISEMTKMN